MSTGTVKVGRTIVFEKTTVSEAAWSLTTAAGWPGEETVPEGLERLLSSRKPVTLITALSHL